MANLNDLGNDYQLSHLEESDLEASPIQQFEKWLNEAIQSNVKDANAFALSTVNDQGLVTSRMMLLKFVDDNGFVFFTNYESPKSQSILSHPQASILFWWPSFERQIRVLGEIKKLDPKHSDMYFEKREKESNIASTLSKQSQVLHDKQVFIDHFQAERNSLSQQKNIPRPEHWGGFILNPNYFEFWQGGPHRLHDRLTYEQNGNDWRIQRLYP